MTTYTADALAAVARLQAVAWDELRSLLQSISRPVRYANGVRDVMIPAVAS